MSSKRTSGASSTNSAVYPACDQLAGTIALVLPLPPLGGGGGALPLGGGALPLGADGAEPDGAEPDGAEALRLADGAEALRLADGAEADDGEPELGDPELDGLESELDGLDDFDPSPDDPAPTALADNRRARGGTACGVPPL